jgi:general secretion pathway protein A
MYEEYYGFTEKPFSLTPDPKYLFKSEAHANALELLQYGIRRREGFVVVTGDIGTGKTTLCRALLEQIDRNTFSALVLNPFLSEEDLLKLILQDFGVVSRDDVKRGRLNGVSKQELIETIYDFLLGLVPLRASAVLIIDEAQNLPIPVLEQIRILSNLETDKDKLLQVILVGQLNLQTLLKAPQMRQLDQRVSIRFELKPLDRDETAAYVTHRVMVAGGASSVSFQPRALDLIHRLAGGIPRVINLICDRALLAAYSARTKEVSPELVQKAGDSLELVAPKPAPLAWLRKPAAIVTSTAAALSLALTGGAISSGSLKGSESPVAPAAPPRPPLVTAPAIRPTATEPPMETSTSEFSSRYAVLAASFPLKDLIHGGSTSVKLEEITDRLRALGYVPWLADVDLKAHGAWRRVLIGEFSTLAEAISRARELHQNEQFADAQPIRY